MDTETIIYNPPLRRAVCSFSFLIDVCFLLFIFVVSMLQFDCFIVYAAIVIIGKEATMPTLITLAASLPQFQHPFTMTSVPPNRFQTGVASDEDALDKARSCFMEGMYLLSEVSLRMKTCSEELSKRQVVFDKALEGLKQL